MIARHPDFAVHLVDQRADARIARQLGQHDYARHLEQQIEAEADRLQQAWEAEHGRPTVDPDPRCQVCGRDVTPECWGVCARCDDSDEF